ncbi:MAG: phosphatidylserine decarboxylase family protein [Bacteroidetes bacterium]|nr:phosphatidylserine decarboxylase family protein [Bacteroidota bacterium]MBU1578363.1 phosphatidylserine decarboxylase family protein [Bacteroidota bacterium]MBU2559000.1 phosphatidylserine decarboxylase family protein [Bacteroidota bacterium]
MHIHREGYKIIFITLLIIGLIVSVINVLAPEQQWFHYLFYVLLLGWAVWTFAFFRVPHRKLNIEDINQVLAAADGTVVAIEEVEEPEYFKDKRIQVSVFMSPFNVHVNWYPIAGEVSYTKYHPGKFLVAYHPKSSTENERNTVVVRAEDGQEVLIRQIAGMMARRIISYAAKGDDAVPGKEFGIIRFGSRVDFLLPADATVHVKIGQKVRALKTTVASLKKLNA